MNKIYRNAVSLFVLFFFLPLFIFSQETEADSLDFEGFEERKLPFKENVIKSNIIPVIAGQIPFCGELRFTYERMLSHNQSVTLGLSYNYPSLLLFVLPAIFNPTNSILSEVSMRGGRVTFGYRFYPLKRKEAPEGFFAGVYGSYNFVKLKLRNGNGSYSVLNYANGSAIAGYQFLLSQKGVFLELFGGVGYRKNFIIDYDAHYRTTTRRDYVIFENNPFKNVKVILQINIGYGF